MRLRLLVAANVQPSNKCSRWTQAKTFCCRSRSSAKKKLSKHETCENLTDLSFCDVTWREKLPRQQQASAKSREGCRRNRPLGRRDVVVGEVLVFDLLVQEPRVPGPHDEVEEPQELKIENNQGRNACHSRTSTHDKTRVTHVGLTTNYRCDTLCQKRSELGQGNILNEKRALPIGENVLKSTAYLLRLASKTSFSELYGEPSQAPTLLCLPCCAILACSKVGIWD